MTGRIFIVPNTIGGSISSSIPLDVQGVIKKTNYFIVENAKNARAYIKKIDKNINISKLHIWQLDEFGSLCRDNIENLFIALKKSSDVVLLSDAGTPCVADPGRSVIRWAHENNIKVIPMVGPSSIIMAISASGLNGQNFSFRGYLPIKSAQRISYIKCTEKELYKYNRTQVFIETPYRNNHLYSDLVMYCSPSTVLSIAISITTEKEKILTDIIYNWKKNQITLPKEPSIFMLGKY